MAGCMTLLARLLIECVEYSYYSILHIFFLQLAWSRKSFSDLSHVHINFYANPIICSKCNIKKTDTVHVFGNIIEVRYNKVTYQNMFGRWCLTVNYSLHIHFKQWLLYSQEDKSLDKNLLLPIQLLNNLA